MGDLIWLMLLIGVLVYLVCLAIYRLYFHPLSKFPGPKLAALTDYWELYQDFFREESGYLFIELDNLHEEYGILPWNTSIDFRMHFYNVHAGPVVRIRPNEVHVKDSNWMDVLYTGPSDVCSSSHSVCSILLMHVFDSLATAIRWLVRPLALPLQVF